MHKLLKSLVALALALSATAGHTLAYPSKPVRLIVPYAVGQGTDIAARYLGDELSKALNQPIVIDNRPGVGGNLGTQIAARSPADGYTMLIGTNATHAAHAFLYTNPGFDPQADFESIAMVGILPLVYVTAPGNPVNSIQDLVRAARAKPDGLNTAKSTTTCRMPHELFKQLGVTSARSCKLLPGVKSIAEQGVAGYELVGWTVLYAPKGLPLEASRALAAAGNKTLGRTDVQDTLLQTGIDPVMRTGDELTAFVAAEKDKWGRLINGAGLKAN
jgi:tripartite-type tricarboxylate transporter receptor subunit TctC